MTLFGSSLRGRAKAIVYTQSLGTTAEPRTHNLPVPSECATCYATDASNPLIARERVEFPPKIIIQVVEFIS